MVIELKRVPLDFQWPMAEPPTGDGYQIWETVKGSPISPVFATPEELAQHMAGTRWGADKGSSVETFYEDIVPLVAVVVVIACAAFIFGYILGSLDHSHPVWMPSGCRVEFSRT